MPLTIEQIKNVFFYIKKCEKGTLSMYFSILQRASS